ncbi:hypothetical protein GJ496_002303 [Pomphorhynchus laevis]|nr:hypothetical protein GJ496_002303 [Pomphorhynchus laevis]
MHFARSIPYSNHTLSFLDDQSIEVITKLLQHVDTFVTRGAAWVLINLTYISDQQTMPLILRNLSVPAVQRMLNSSDIEVWEKAFGLIQNMMAYEAQEDVSNLKELARIAVAAIETQLRGVMTENDKKQQATICLLSSIASSFYSPMITNDLISLSLQHINTRNCQLSRLLVRCLNQMLNHNDPHVWKHRMCTETEAYNTIYGSLNGSFSKDYLLEAAEFIQKCGAIF